MKNWSYHQKPIKNQVTDDNAFIYIPYRVGNSFRKRLLSQWDKQSEVLTSVCPVSMTDRPLTRLNAELLATHGYVKTDPTPAFCLLILNMYSVSCETGVNMFLEWNWPVNVNMTIACSEGWGGSRWLVGFIPTWTTYSRHNISRFDWTQHTTCPRSISIGGTFWLLVPCTTPWTRYSSG